MRFIKILLSLIAIFIALVIAAPFFLEPNDFKDEIATAVEKATGRKLAIAGDLELSIFPWLGLKTGKLELGNRTGFAKNAFAVIDTAQIRVKLLPLLSNQVEMDSLVLSGLSLNLERLKNGQDNWSDLSARSDKPASKDAPPTDTRKLAALAIGGVSLDKTSIRYRDAQTKQDLKLTELSLQTGPLELGAPVDIELSTQLSAQQPAVNGSFTLSTQLQANPFDGTYLLKDSQLSLDLKGKQLPAGRINGTLDATIAANLIKQTLELSGLKLLSEPLKVSGNLNVSRIFDNNPTLAGKLKVADFNPKKLFKKLAIAVPTTADPNALKQASFDTNIGGSLENIKLAELKLILDDSLIQGKINIRNKNRKAVNYSLQLDRIDLDRYLAGTPKQARSFGLIPVAIAAVQPTPLFPVDLLRSFDMSGDITAGQLIMNRLLIENINIKVNQQQGLLKLDPIKGKAYDGNYLGHINIDARRQHGKTPVVSVNESLTGVNIEPVIKAITGKDALSGTGNVSAVLTTRGQTIPALKKVLNGEIKMSLSNGALKGVDLIKVMRDTYAQYKRQNNKGAPDQQETPFTNMNVSFQVHNGIMRSNDLVITSALPRIRGKGAINLNNNTLDYTLKTSVNEDMINLVGLDKSLKGVPLRIKLHGNLSSPSYSVDWVKTLGRALEKTQKQKLIDSILGKKKKKQPSITNPPPVTPAPTVQKAPPKPETPEERKKRKKREKKEKIEKLLKGLF